MSQKRTNRNRTQPTNKPVPPVNSRDEQANNSVQQVENNEQPTGNTQEKKSVLKRVVAFVGNDKDQTTIANVISLLMLLVTAFLAYYTWKVFTQTTQQTIIANKSADAAKVSADAAKKSADLQKQALDSQVSYQKKADIADAAKLKRDTTFVKKQTEGIESQIAALKETQKEFDLTNQSYLQVAQFDTGKIGANVISLKFDITNIGAQPAKIKFGFIAGFIDRSFFYDYKKIYDKFKGKEPYAAENIYVIRGAPQHETMILDNAGYSAADMANLRNGTYSWYIYGAYKYQNITNKKYMKYIFAVHINVNNGVNYDMLYNENISDKYKK